MKTKILICTPLFFPGTKGGGPIRSVLNLVNALKEYYDIYIYTMDRDLGDKNPYSNIQCDKWIHLEGYSIFYASPKNIKIHSIKENIDFNQFKIIYVNSFFSNLSIYVLFILKKQKNSKVIIAPRGEFAKSAIGLGKFKKIKKIIYIILYKYFIHRSDIVWHSTAINETKDIRRLFADESIIQVPNIASQNNEKLNLIKKEVGSLKIIYMSRISRIKNLHLSLDILKNIKGNIIYDIYGPIEDARYWSECSEIINKLPKNVKVLYRGIAPSENTFKILSDYHVFLLPTQGENFGHSIYEAMSSGCIPIISNNTPWRDLRNLNIGWDIPIDNLESFTEAIQKCVDFNQHQFNVLRKNNYQFIENYKKNMNTVEKMRKMFTY